jgi:ABC-type Fe3+-hydroxamate transport system substrate-binding protein
MRLRPAAPAAAFMLAIAAASLGAAAAPAPRIVSLNPSLTAILLALGARESLVGVDDRSSRQEASLASLPTVGGLFDTSLEAVVSLEPDVVVLVPSAEQRDLARGSARWASGARAPEYHARRAARFDRGARPPRRPRGGAARVAEIRAALAAAARASAGRKPLRAVLALQREPLYGVGAGSYLDSLLRAAGALNAAAELGGPYPRAGLEWLIAARPDVILDASDEPEDAAAYWSRWPSLPAVASGRVVALPAREVTLPGPWLERALAHLAQALHGEGPPR